MIPVIASAVVGVAALAGALLLVAAGAGHLRQPRRLRPAPGALAQPPRRAARHRGDGNGRRHLRPRRPSQAPQGGGRAAPTRPGGCRGTGPVRPIPATWRVCNPASADVSAGYCASNGYNRTDAKRVSSCATLDYRLDYRCGRIPGTRRNYNAWTWRRGESGGNKRSVRCSDGLVYVLDRCGPDYHYKTACKRYL